MSVHFGPEQGRIRTIKHKRAYCQCVDGTYCNEDAKPPKKNVVNKKLEGRIKGWEETNRTPGAKGSRFFHKPGSMNPKK